VNNWKKYTDDQWILQTVKGYCIDFDSIPYQSSLPNEIPFSEEEKLLVSDAVEEPGNQSSMFLIFLLFPSQMERCVLL
jgi:hypothetical protein